MVIERGEIWWATLPEPRGSEPGFSRPVLVVQSDEFNRSYISTVVAVAITSNVFQARAPGNVFLHRKVSGLPKDSVVNISQIVTIDKSFLTKRVRKLGKREMLAIEAGIQLILLPKN